MCSFPLELEDGKHKYDKEDRKEENTAIESIESKRETLVSKRCRRKLEPGKTLILNIRRSRARERCRELSIPKHITTLDEKYVLRCLELIRNCALRAAAWNFTSTGDIFPYDMSNLAEIKNISSNNMSSLAIECPLIGGAEVIMDSCIDWTIGTVSGSQSMINILNSPLLQKFGSLDRDVNCGSTNLLDISEPFCSDFADSIQEPQKQVKFLDYNYASAPAHKRDASISSTNSSCSDQSSSSTCSTSFQGMLQCTWKDGLPHHVFTVDDKREVYEANLSEFESLDDKGLDYIYTFHARRNSKKECDIHELESDSVAKMRVSTSITFASDNHLEVRKTQFILSVSSDNHTGEVQSSNHTAKKTKKLTRKVVEVFRSNKRRSSSKLGGSSSAILEDTPWDPSEDMLNNSLDPGEGSAENKYMPNLELAAIIVKDICTINPKEPEVGGWGLKFLKKPRNNASLETSTRSDSSRNTGDCSTSMDILIPAGIHGGPRTRVGGPSSLIERWISGGHCDCGGWDIGCPLTMLNTRSSTGFSSPAYNSGPCKSVDLFVKGSKQNVPIMKMVNIHDGLYYIHIQSTLSTLQSFAIAAAIIHSQNPVLRSKVYRS